MTTPKRDVEFQALLEKVTTAVCACKDAQWAMSAKHEGIQGELSSDEVFAIMITL